MVNQLSTNLNCWIPHSKTYNLILKTLYTIQNMWQFSQGIPNIPHITHLQELIELGNQLLKASLILIIITGFLGIGIAIINFSFRHRQESEANILINELVSRYSSLLKSIPKNCGG